MSDDNPQVNECGNDCQNCLTYYSPNGSKVFKCGSSNISFTVILAILIILGVLICLIFIIFVIIKIRKKNKFFGVSHVKNSKKTQIQSNNIGCTDLKANNIDLARQINKCEIEEEMNNIEIIECKSNEYIVPKIRNRIDPPYINSEEHKGTDFNSYKISSTNRNEDSKNSMNNLVRVIKPMNILNDIGELVNSENERNKVKQGGTTKIKKDLPPIDKDAIRSNGDKSRTLHRRKTKIKYKTLKRIDTSLSKSRGDSSEKITLDTRHN